MGVTWIGEKRGRKAADSKSGRRDKIEAKEKASFRDAAAMENHQRPPAARGVAHLSRNHAVELPDSGEFRSQESEYRMMNRLVSARPDSFSRRFHPEFSILTPLF
jgi:hypothetical protein